MDHQPAETIEGSVNGSHDQASTRTETDPGDAGNIAPIRDTSEVLRIVKDYCQDVPKRQQLLDGIGRTSSGNVTLSSFQSSVCSSPDMSLLGCTCIPGGKSYTQLLHHLYVAWQMSTSALLGPYASSLSSSS